MYNSEPVVSFVCLTGVIIVLFLIMSCIKRFKARISEEVKEFYSSIINNADVGLYRADLNGRCLYANTFFKNLVKTLPSVHKNDDQNIIVPICEDSLKHKVFLRSLLAGGKIQESESCFLNENGQDLYLVETARLVCDMSGKPVGIAGVVRNISDVKILENTLELEKSYLTAVMDNFSGGVFIEDFTGKFLKVNRSFADYAGVNNPELCVGSNVCNYLSSRHSSVILENISNVAQTGEDSFLTLQVDDIQGKKFNLSVKHSLFRNHKGEPAAIIGYARKVEGTENISAAEDRSSLHNYSNTAYSLSNLCHELRTPFVGIIGSLKALAEEELSDRAKCYADKALKSAERFKEALNYFLHDFLLDDTSEKELPFFDSEAAFLKILDMYIPAVELENRGIEFFIKEDTPKKISGNRREFLQAIFCLIGNGISVLQGATLTAGIEVHNLTENETEFLFFVRDGSDKGTKAHSHQLSGVFVETVRKLGGETFCNTEQGFTIGFKVAIASYSDDSSAEKVTGINKSVLLAEDDISSQFMMRKKLEKCGYTVRTVSTGLEVLACLKERSYDLVLMDVQMPEMNGFDAIKAIRDMEYGERRIPIVVMSAYGADIDTKQMALLGINEFISKPIRTEMLENVISKYMS